MPQYKNARRRLFSQCILYIAPRSIKSSLLSKHRLLRAAALATKSLYRIGSLAYLSGECRSLLQCPHLPISEVEDDPEIRSRYRPFLLDVATEATDQISALELETTVSMAEADLAKTRTRLRVLILYGSLRKRQASLSSTRQASLTFVTKRSYSKLIAFEAACILYRLGCDVRIFNPSSLPIRDSVEALHPSV